METRLGVEIERKFLVADDSWKSAVTEAIRLEDGLVARFGGGKVRVRHGGDRAWITIKGPRDGCCRAEFEYEIPPDHAAEMLRLCQEPTVVKTRHCVPYAGHLWSVDVYEGLLAGTMIAEVELSSADEAIQLPPWIASEVTTDVRYSKQNMVRQASEGADQD